MKKMQAFKFKLKTKSKKANLLLRFSGSCRYVYNRALELQIKRYESSEKHLSYAKLCSQLTQWKREKTWLSEAPSQSLQQSLKDLDKAYQHFFQKRAGFPKLKKRGMKDSFRLPQGCKLDQDRNRLFIPKLGWINYVNTQQVLGEIKNVTISRKGENWYASIQTEREVEQPIHRSSTIVGIDVGIKYFAVLSNKETYASCHALKRKEKKLSRLQKGLSRKIKFSNNWKKQKLKISTWHQHIANTRLDYLHKTSTQISKNHAIVVLEDLQIKNMSKSTKGNLENPGKQVKAKSGLNKAILDQGWGEFRRQLTYKSDWLGGDVILVDPKYTSQTCPHCHLIDRANRKTRDQFECIACGFGNEADYVGSLNILAAGHAVLACGERVSQCPSVKQEPTRTAASAA